MISVTTNSLPFEGKKGVGGIRSVDSVGLGRCSVQVHLDERPGVELVVATCQHRTKLAARCLNATAIAASGQQMTAQAIR